MYIMFKFLGSIIIGSLIANRLNFGSIEAGLLCTGIFMLYANSNDIEKGK